MTKENKPETLSQWKERIRDGLKSLADESARRAGVTLRTSGTRPMHTEFLRKVVLVTDPIKITFEDMYGGNFTCTYDISKTLGGLCHKFQDMEVPTDSEITAFAKSENISHDEAMAKIASRYVEADTFSKLKAGRFLHEQLQPALEEMIRELLDDAFMQAIREYGFEIVEPAKTLEKVGRNHIKYRKRRSGFVPNPGRPPAWTKEEVLAKVSIALSKQKKKPTLRATAEAMNYGGLSGGASALGKLLKDYEIDWKRLKREWEEAKKRT